ncbi:MAG: hypothetical protein QF752_09385 [Planctomycetota bacterium]|nr:hypothetical protein [Planctomycetota bacterium]
MSNSPAPNDSSPETPSLQCPLCNSELLRISLVCPHCRGEIEEFILSALQSSSKNRSSTTFPPLSEEDRNREKRNRRDLNRATLVVMLSLALTWFFVYVLTA